MPVRAAVRHFLRSRPVDRVPVVIFAVAVLLWVVLWRLDILDRWSPEGVSTSHHVFDHLALLGFNLSVALALASMWQGRQLRHAVAEREAERARAERNTRFDPLTGLPNRRSFETAMRDIATTGGDPGPRVLAILDLSRFKPVNDVHGHVAGDETLKVVARRLRDLFRGIAQVARLGGDEFALLFGPSCEADLAERYARRLILALEEPIDAGGVTVRIGCCVGLAVWSRGEEVPAALRRADRALHDAKGCTAMYAWYDAERDRQATERAELAADLRDAIRLGRVVPYFQPLVDLGTRRLCGFEVLARWTHPTRGEIPPGVFIAIAEDVGLVNDLGWSIVRQACARAAGWSADLHISVNLSPAQFQDQGLAVLLSAILIETNFPAARLEVEITEAAVIRDFAAARQTIVRLRALGISVALDDFGTGYSSLTSLRELPFDRIKIDRAFVTGIARSPERQKLVAGIMALARSLGLQVTAEGIETDEDLQVMSELECGRGQGFLFERPISGDATEWLMDTRWSGREEPAHPRAPPSRRSRTRRE
jgi:diguanylate cyclase (GGDEF)-like protein